MANITISNLRTAISENFLKQISEQEKNIVGGQPWDWISGISVESDGIYTTTTIKLFGGLLIYIDIR
ncbi:MAG: hypothetical protein MUD14_14340 [Hydrococcus sp. Prado102]|jgi:hypothetical protein|nr:hypothetical protein [Hydrococcus sp. Prado102]